MTGHMTPIVPKIIMNYNGSFQILAMTFKSKYINHSYTEYILYNEYSCVYVSKHYLPSKASWSSKPGQVPLL